MQFGVRRGADETRNQEMHMKALLRASLFMLFAAYAAGALAQNSPPRGGKWEFTLQPQYVHSQSFDSGNGTGGTVGSSLGFGFGVGYNLNNHLTLGGDFFWNSANYDATYAGAGAGAGTTATVSGVLSTSTIRFNATWNFLQSDFTPFVIGGIGSTYVDTNIPAAPPTNQCWYDPWWGYYCGTYVPTKYAYYVSYSGGVGVRWDLDRNIFLRAVANRMWIDVGGSLGQPYTDQYRFDVGFKF
jgi:Outer membrane protein beta-barrel domain